MPTPDILWELNYHQRFPWRSPRIPGSQLAGRETARTVCGYQPRTLRVWLSGGAKLSQAANQLDILNYSWRDYGNRVGAWYLADLFAELTIPPAVISNTAILDYCPDLCIGGFRCPEAN
jgi:hypothetical protein